MSRLSYRCKYAFLFSLLVLFLGPVLQAAQPAATSAMLEATTHPSTSATTHSMGEYGKDVIMLDKLVEQYEPVPFAHRRHAEMAEMRDGCETCHHHTPTTAPSAGLTARYTQDDAARVPACKSCHPEAPSQVEMEMPSLKGAYHRQCLNCHRDWMGANACVICHATREGSAASMPTTRPPTADDIVGRMHKPLTPPTEKQIVARYTPVDGANVFFRHDEHVKEFGIKCVACHRRDVCADCHGNNPATAASAPSRMLKPGQTWQQTHEPCVSCHERDRCDHCHYQPGQEPPVPFKHQSTGQTLDKDHLKIACGECHEHYKSAPALTCSESECHKRKVSFPTDRPGAFIPPAITTKATTVAAADTAATQATTQPTTRPIIIRIRRGVQ